MIARFAQSLVLIGSLTLALPAGWCGMVLASMDDAPRSTRPHCCQSANPHPEKGSVPDEPRVDCCCQRDAIPVRGLELSDVVFPAFWGTAVAAEPTRASEVQPAPELLAPSVPARVLQCVWIC